MSLNDSGYDTKLQKTLQEDPNLIALAIWPVDGELHRAFQPDVIKREEVDERVSEVLARMSGRGLVVSRPQIIRSGQEMALTVAAPVMGGEQSRCGRCGSCHRFIPGSFQGCSATNFQE